MKKTILSLALLILAGGATAQTDKAAAKAAAKALKDSARFCWMSHFSVISSLGNKLQVTPSSAPMLVIVAR